MNRDNDSRPSDDELHASLHALLHSGDFGTDEPADDNTVRHDVSRILRRAGVEPAAVQDPPAESLAGSQDSWSCQAERNRMIPPTRSRRPKRQSRRPGRSRPARDRATAPSRLRVPTLPRARGVESFVSMAIFIIAIGLAAALFVITRSIEEATGVIIAAGALALSSGRLKR